MILSNKLATLDQVRAENRFLRRLLLALVLLLAMLVLAAVVFAPRNRSTLIPPAVHQSFWVEDDRVSPEYLEEMGVFIGRAYLDLTSDNVDYNMRLLLRYATPALHGSMQAEMMAARSRLSDNNATSEVAIKEVRTDPRRMRVALLGSLVTRIAGRVVSRTPSAWAIDFAYSNGRIQFTNIRETSNDDPFGDKRPAARS